MDEIELLVAGSGATAAAVLLGGGLMWRWHPLRRWRERHLDREVVEARQKLRAMLEDIRAKRRGYTLEQLREAAVHAGLDPEPYLTSKADLDAAWRRQL